MKWAAQGLLRSQRGQSTAGTWTPSLPGVIWQGASSFPSALGLDILGQSCSCSPCQPALCRPSWELQSWRPQVFVSPLALGTSIEKVDLLT